MKECKERKKDLSASLNIKYYKQIVRLTETFNNRKQKGPGQTFQLFCLSGTNISKPLGPAFNKNAFLKVQGEGNLGSRLTSDLSVSARPAGSSGSSSSSTLNGSGHCQNHSALVAQAPLPAAAASHSQRGKGTFTDDLHQLVDNWARDAISLSQCKRGPKTGAPGPQGHDVGICTPVLWDRGGVFIRILEFLESKNSNILMKPILSF